jgi:S-formylglutathione hydrolase FrmB
VDETFQSEALGRPMKYRVLLPAAYDQNQRRFPALYLLHGLTGSYTDWETRTRLFDHVRGLGLIVVMPDGGDAWYTNSAGDPKDRFEDYIVRDVVRDVDAKFRTIQTRHMRALAGLSMGGYGALKLALKFPGTFQFVGSFSGALMVAADPEFGKNLEKFYEGIQRIFGPAGSKTRLENDIYLLVTKADPARMPFLYIDCGIEDGLLQSNRDFVALLTKQKVAYEYRELPGAHTWAYWDHQLPEMLRVMMEQMRLGPAR